MASAVAVFSRLALTANRRIKWTLPFTCANEAHGQIIFQTNKVRMERALFCHQDGGQGRNRTVDTGIFRRTWPSLINLLIQLLAALADCFVPYLSGD